MMSSLYHNERTGRDVLKCKFDIQFFGGGSSTQQIQKRNPEPEELTNLRNKLYQAVLPGVEAYDPSSWKQAAERSQNAQKQQDALIGQQSSLLSGLPGALDKSSGILDEMLGVVRSGAVPTALTDAANASVNKGLKSGMGSMLNSLAGRGVVNSSIASKGINGLAQNAADAMNTNYLNAFNSVLSGYGTALSGAQGNANTLVNGAGALGNAIGTLGNIPSQAYENTTAQIMPAFNLWKAWQNSYDNREDYDTVVKQGK